MDVIMKGGEGGVAAGFEHFYCQGFDAVNAK
jgi:hypothetical protein